MTILSNSNTTSYIGILLSSIFEMPSASGMKTDLQPDSDVAPNPFTVDERTIRIDNKQFWLEPGLAQYGTFPVNSWLL